MRAGRTWGGRENMDRREGKKESKIMNAYAALFEVMYYK